AQALGRSRGGFSTKIHVSTDGLDNLLRFALTGGQRHDITQAEALCEGWTCQYVIAERTYDAAAFLQRIAECDATPVIPPRPNRLEPREYDAHLLYRSAISSNASSASSSITGASFHALRSSLVATSASSTSLAHSFGCAKCQHNLVTRPVW